MPTTRSEARPERDDPEGGALRIVILGKQGAGKGTQAARLAERYGIAHLSTGDLLREQAASGSRVGREAEEYMDRGELVPDDVMIAIVAESLAPGGPLADGFILDGFPRTLEQAEALEQAVGDHPIDVVLNLEVPHDVAVARMLERGRHDDTEEAIERRLELYERETFPIVEYYRDRDRLVVVDGVGTPDEIYERLADAVDRRASA